MQITVSARRAVRSADAIIAAISDCPASASALRCALLSSTEGVPLEHVDEHRRFIIGAAEFAGLNHQRDLIQEEIRGELAVRFGACTGIPYFGEAVRRERFLEFADVLEVNCAQSSRNLPAGRICFSATPVRKVPVRLPDSAIAAIAEFGSIYEGLFYLEPIFIRSRLATSLEALRRTATARVVDPIVVGTLGRPVPIPILIGEAQHVGRHLFKICHWD